MSSRHSACGHRRSKQVVAYDQSNGMWAVALVVDRCNGWDIARRQCSDGGLDRWLAEGRLLTAEEPRVQPAKFIAGQTRPVATAREIVEHLDDGALTVIDARAPSATAARSSRSTRSPAIFQAR
jgi:3-mercaptopyruvate sulfurtransferase SseA